MIEINNISKALPYKYFKQYFDKAISNNQENLEAVSISSLDLNSMEVESRFVNLKYINHDKWIFFTNYNSPKSKAFDTHDQVSALFYWNKINTQIRMKAKIEQCTVSLSDQHFAKRSHEKNAIAVSSKQSEAIESYEMVINNYKEVLNNNAILSSRPESWGGFSFTPYYFEFWEGSDFRLNKRVSYSLVNSKWVKAYLQP